MCDGKHNTHVISFQLDSVAEDKGVEVGLLKHFIKGSFILKVRK